MNLERIMKKISTGIQDPSFSEGEDFLPLVNEFVDEVSRLFRLPALQAQDTKTITTSLTTNKVAMPDDYHRELYRVYNDTSMKMCGIRSSIKALEDVYDGWDSTGFVRDVAIDDSYLWFKPMPVQDQELTLFYYRKPVPIANLTDGSAELDGIPDHLTKVAVDYALKELFPLVEDGIEGRQVNTDKYEARYQTGLLMFQEHCKTAPKQTPVVKRSARFF